MIPRSADELTDPDAFKEDGSRKQDPDVTLLGRRRNAADPKRLQVQATRDAVQEVDDENDLREIVALASGAGRRFLARLLEKCNWNAEYFHPSNSVMSYAAGRREVSRVVENWLADAGLEVWIAVRTELEQQRTKPVAQDKRRSTPTV